MYLAYYGLKEKPFDISTDPRFLWLGEKHKEAFAVLKYGVMENKGFLLLTGDVGAGKTTLIHALVEGVGEDVILATIPDPGLELMEFYRYLARAFNLDNSFSNKADFIFIFREFLHHAYDNGKKVLLIIDEAQRLPNTLLEEIRLLSNIELHDTKLLNIFFVGQVEFNTKLIEPENRAVRQRITISNHIQPLTEKETGDYIRHRLKVAGCQKNVFSFVAIHEIHKFSGGYPRLINIVCDIALLTGYVKEVKKVGPEIVRESIESLNIESHTREKVDEQNRRNVAVGPDPSPVQVTMAHPVPEPLERGSRPRKNGWHRAAILYIFLLLVIALGYLLYSQDVMDVLNRYLPSVRGENVPVVETEIPASVPVDSASAEPAAPSSASPEPAASDQKQVFPLSDQSEGNAQASAAPSVLPSGGDDPVTLDSHFTNNRLLLEYKHNSNELTDDGFKVLEKLARFMRMNPDVFVLVTGYSDDLGNYSYNVNLSLFRANIVKSYLVGKGIDVSRIRVTGLGPENPRASNSTAEGRRMNRRVEIEIMNMSAG
jgi:general secretion pathway protein A